MVIELLVGMKCRLMIIRKERDKEGVVPFLEMTCPVAYPNGQREKRQGTCQNQILIAILVDVTGNQSQADAFAAWPENLGSSFRLGTERDVNFIAVLCEFYFGPIELTVAIEVGIHQTLVGKPRTALFQGD